VGSLPASRACMGEPRHDAAPAVWPADRAGLRAVLCWWALFTSGEDNSLLESWFVAIGELKAIGQCRITRS
jgi:hypothetical protein